MRPLMVIGGVVAAAWLLWRWVIAAAAGFAPTSDIDKAAGEHGLYWPLVLGGLIVLAVLAVNITRQVRTCRALEEQREECRRFLRERGVDMDAEIAKRHAKRRK